MPRFISPVCSCNVVNLVGPSRYIGKFSTSIQTWRPSIMILVTRCRDLANSRPLRSPRRTLELLPNARSSTVLISDNAEFRAGHLDAALRAYQRAIELQPDFSDAHYNLANLLREQGHSDEAITYYRRAIELNPAATAAASNLGQLLQSQGEFAEAERLFRRVIEQQPTRLMPGQSRAAGSRLIGGSMRLPKRFAAR